MATDLLKLFAQKNGCFPNKIVFYRDGKLVSFDGLVEFDFMFRC